MARATARVSWAAVALLCCGMHHSASNLLGSHSQKAERTANPLCNGLARPPPRLWASSCRAPSVVSCTHRNSRVASSAQMQYLGGLPARHQQAALHLLRQASILSEASCSQLLQQPGVLQSHSQLERQELEVRWPADGTQARGQGPRGLFPSRSRSLSSSHSQCRVRPALCPAEPCLCAVDGLRPDPTTTRSNYEVPDTDCRTSRSGGNSCSLSVPLTATRPPLTVPCTARHPCSVPVALNGDLLDEDMRPLLNFRSNPCKDSAAPACEYMCLTSAQL